MKTLWMFIFLAASSLPSIASEPCKGCETAKEAAKSQAGRHGGPQQGLVCVRVHMPDPCDAIAIEIETEKVSTIQYRRGAAVYMAGSSPAQAGQNLSCNGSEKATVCLEKEVVAAAKEIRLISGNQGSCYRFRANDELEFLRRPAGWPAHKPVHIGWATAGAKNAPEGFKTLAKRAD